MNCIFISLFCNRCVQTCFVYTTHIVTDSNVRFLFSFHLRNSLFFSFLLYTFVVAISNWTGFTIGQTELDMQHYKWVWYIIVFNFMPFDLPITTCVRYRVVELSKFLQIECDAIYFYDIFSVKIEVKIIFRSDRMCSIGLLI